MNNQLVLYPRSLTLKNIKSLAEIFYEFPKVEFDLDGKPIIKRGVLLTGSNFIGKTTLLQAINTSLKNDIGDLLKPDEALREGTRSGIIDFELISPAGDVYRITNKYNRDIDALEDAQVEHTWSLTGKDINLQSYQSGSLTALRNFLGYHYISPNDIMMLSQTVPGRRKLMKHFLNSVPPDVRDKYLEWEELEQTHFEIRSKKHITLMKLETVKESLALTPIEENTLKSSEDVLKELELLNKQRDEKVTEIGNYERQFNAIYAPEGVELTELNYNLYAEFTPVYWANQETVYTHLKVKDELKLKEKVIANTELKGKFDPIIAKLKVEVDKASLETYSDIQQAIKEAYNALINLDTKVGSEITSLNESIAKYGTLIKECDETKTIATRHLNNLIVALPDDKPTTLIVDAKLATYTLKTKELDRINEKKLALSLKTDEVAEAYQSWKEQDDLVAQARDAKKQIIIENNIEVEGFEFTPDGVILNDHIFAERNVSGADRRIAACQFTMAMNSTVKIGILEEMESLDNSQEQRIFKFAANRGYVIISDNVTKEVIDKVQIEEVIIN